MFLIYLITNTINGKKYVGKTGRTLLQRWGNHIRESRRKQNSLIRRAIHKYGSNSFEIKEIDRTNSFEISNYREMFWIAALQTYRRPLGYNLTYGGEGGMATLEMKEKISKANTGKIRTKEMRARLSLAKLGSKLSEETKAKIAAAGRGRKASLETKIKLSLSKKGRIVSEEARHRLSIAAKAQWSIWWIKRILSDFPIERFNFTQSA